METSCQADSVQFDIPSPFEVDPINYAYGEHPTLQIPETKSKEGICLVTKVEILDGQLELHPDFLPEYTSSNGKTIFQVKDPAAAISMAIYKVRVTADGGYS